MDVFCLVMLVIFCCGHVVHSRPSNKQEHGKLRNDTASGNFTASQNKSFVSQKLDEKNVNNKVRHLDASEMLKILLKNYDRRIRPGLEEGPVEVQVNMFVSSIEGFQELTMDFSMTIYFRQWWRDSRLAYGDMYHRDSVTIGGDILKQIWLPDTHFEYEKKPKDRTRDHVFLLKLWRDGTIMWSRSDSITTTCAMDLRSYPMDTQRCNFSIESFGYPINDVVYKWRLGRSDEDIKVKQDLALTKFTLWKIQTFTKISHYVTGSFSGIVAEFTMTRRALYYVIQIFLPCAMIVFLSWSLDARSYRSRDHNCTIDDDTSFRRPIVPAKGPVCQVPGCLHVCVVHAGLCVSDRVRMRALQHHKKRQGGVPGRPATEADPHGEGHR
ncbi:glycine receptor subunit alpha-2 isoform X3 [Nematostella vectensis]|uniref:glycine receptor subunit alpha-2 isoform X3 n=1 Tax=Nematostella vectensis TaxID=45351 RepID=UPI00138FC7F3|nr:glycine receptor subunit alpha-2 isoform X3 [Nematostella vectensis]